MADRSFHYYGKQVDGMPPLGPVEIRFLEETSFYEGKLKPWAHRTKERLLLRLEEIRCRITGKGLSVDWLARKYKYCKNHEKNEVMNQILASNSIKKAKVIGERIVNDEHASYEDKIAGIDALVSLGKRKPGIKALKTAIREGPIGVERKARWALIKLGGDEAIRVLVKGLRSKNVRERRDAAEWLGIISEPSTAGVLVKALKDTDYDVEETVRKALVKLGDSAVGPIHKAVFEKRLDMETAEDMLWEIRQNSDLKNGVVKESKKPVDIKNSMARGPGAGLQRLAIAKN